VSGPDGLRAELAQAKQRMAVIREEVTADVEAKWTTPWRTPEVFELKVRTRLAGHREYRTLQERVREGEAALAAEAPPGTSSRPD
jgi:hypothetical protein